MHSIFILFALVLFNGEPRAAYVPFESMSQCVAAKTQAVNDAVANGITDGAFTCTEYKIAKLT